METLTLTCLGGFAARCGEREVEIGPRKVRALLAYLALAGPGRHRREALAGLLWGRSAQRQALNSLNQALYTLRRALDAAGCDLLESDAETVGLRSAGVQTDAAEMEAAAGRDEPASLRQALALHRGPLLDGLSVPEEGFEVWLAAERTRLADVAAAAGVRLMDLAPPADDALPEDARRLLAIDPYSDAACRALVRHHADAGRTARAIAIYEDHARTLHADLGVGPSEAMAHLIAAVRAGKVAPGPPAPPGAAPAAPRRPRALALAIALAVLVSAALGAIFLAKRPDPRPAADRPYLLVLPAASADRAAPQAAIGLIDDLSTELAGLPGLAVFARETARARDDWTSGSARAAGASHMLATTLRDEGGQLTLNARLVETASGIEVWARRFTLRRDSFRQLRDRMVGEIADALAAEFAAGDAATPRIDPEAYESYLAGLAAYHRASPAANAQARGAFARALALDPGLDAARAGLVRVHYRAAFGAQAYADALDLSWIEAYLQLKALIGAAPEAGSAADRAIEARLRLRRHDLAGATATARAALARVPSDAEALLTLAEAAAYLGEVEEALAAARQALALNPARAARAYFAMALAHVGAGATDQAARSLAEAGRGPDAAALVELPALAAAVAGLQGDRHAAREIGRAHV